MSFRNKGLVLAMEEDTVLAAPEGEMDPALPAEVEAGAAEVNEHVAEVEDLNTAIEEAEADAETLGEIQETLAESVEGGEGVDETTAEVAEIAVEAICARLGIKSSQKTIPALESFGSKSSRLTATKVAIEGINDRLKQIWEAIKKAFMTVWQKIKDFFAKFFDNSEKVKKMAEALKDEVKKAEKFKAKGGKIKFGGAGALNVDGKVDLESAKDILSNHEGLTTQVVAASDLLTKAVSALNGAIKGSDDQAELKKALSSSAEAAIQALSKSTKTTVSTEGDVVKANVGPFVNGEGVALTFDGGNMTFSMETTKPSKAAPSEVEALNQAQAGEALNAVISLMTKTTEYKKSQSKFEALNKSCVDLVNAALNVASKTADMSENNKEVKEKLEAARKAVTSINSFSSRLLTLTPAMNVRAGKAVVNYVQASLKTYEEEKKAA